MPWRLVVFIVILGLVVVFAGFNISNVSDVSFGFYKATDVPIFISLFFAFLIGVIIMVPFAVGRKKILGKKGKSTGVEDSSPVEIPADSGIDDR